MVPVAQAPPGDKALKPPNDQDNVDMSSTLPPQPPAGHGQPPSPGAASALVQMSVHSLPDPAMAERTRSGRWKMLLVLLMCAAPVIASYFTYYVIRPQGRLNYGTLIEPVRPLPVADALPLKDLTGQAVAPASLKGRWLLLTVGGGDCTTACEKQLYWQRQIRESLGKDKDKVGRVWLVDDARPVRPALLPAMKDATVLYAARADLAHWLQAQPGHGLSDHWYLVDPRGNWMMRFPVHAEPRKVQKDLARLIRAAGVWEEVPRP